MDVIQAREQNRALEEGKEGIKSEKCKARHALRSIFEKTVTQELNGVRRMACYDVYWRLGLTQEGLRLDDACRSDWDAGGRSAWAVQVGRRR